MSIAEARLGLIALAGRLGPVTRRLLAGGAWALAGEAGARFLAFAAAIVVARVLGPSEYGSFVLVQSTLGMILTFAQFAMGTTAARYVAAYRSTEPTRVEAVVGISLIFSLVSGLLATILLIVASPWVAGTLLGTPDLARLLAIGAAILCLQALTSAMSGVIHGFEAFGVWARLTWVSSAASFFALVGGIWIAGLTGAVGALVLGELLRVALTWQAFRGLMCRAGLRPFRRIDWNQRRLLWQFSLPVLLGAVLHAPVFWLCQAMVARQPNGLVEIALYDAAQKWMTVVTLVPLAASAAFLPVFANLCADNGPLSLRQATTRVVLMQSALAFAPALAVGLAAHLAVRPFGPGFAAAAEVIPITMALAPIFVAKHVYWQALVGAGRAWTALAIGLGWAVLAVGLTALRRDAGAVGLAQAMLGAYGAALLASIMIVERIWRR